MQEGDDELDTAVCAECGEQLPPSLERAFARADERVLCFACAMRRGGVYDERNDRGREPPHVRELDA